MSRIGKRPVPVPSEVTATVDGPHGQDEGTEGRALLHGAREDQGREDGRRHRGRRRVDDTKMARTMWGMSRTMVSNLMHGVTNGYSRTLEIQGVGFRAAMKGKDQLQLNIGFSHDVVHKIPAGVEVKVSGAKQEIITVSGIDRATRRPGRGQHPRLAAARALPGQGHPLSGRVHLPQGRQEEVRTHGYERAHTTCSIGASRASAARLKREFDRPRAPFGAPLVEAHLRAGDRRRRRHDGCRGFDAREGSSRAR